MRLWGSEPLKLDRNLSGFTSLWSYDKTSPCGIFLIYVTCLVFIFFFA